MNWKVLSRLARVDIEKDDRSEREEVVSANVVFFRNFAGKRFYLHWTYCRNQYGWGITEPWTGRCMGFGGTPEEALAQAWFRLSQYGLEVVEYMMKFQGVKRG